MLLTILFWFWGEEGGLCVFLNYLGLIKVVFYRIVISSSFFQCPSFKLPTCSPSCLLPPPPIQIVLYFWDLVWPSNWVPTMLTFDFQPRFGLVLHQFCVLKQNKKLIFVTLTFVAQLYWGYWLDFEILLPSFHFSVLMEAPKLFLCWILFLPLWNNQWRRNNLELSCSVWYTKEAQRQMVWGIFCSCQDHPALRRHRIRDLPKKKKFKKKFLMQVYKNREISFVHGQRGTGQGTGVLHPKKN